VIAGKSTARIAAVRLSCPVVRSTDPNPRINRTGLGSGVGDVQGGIDDHELQLGMVIAVWILGVAQSRVEVVRP
jgi:hypothetical protein